MPHPVNVIVFGETGAGKSSLVNMIVGQQVAVTSPDADGCTLTSKPYSTFLNATPHRSIDEEICLWDTVGLNEPRLGLDGYLDAIGKADELIEELDKCGGIQLLLFVMRGGRITASSQKNYKLFVEVLCGGRVPVAVVITHLEHERVMEDWWKRNERAFKTFGIRYQDHACVTTLAAPNSQQYDESKKAINGVLRGCASLQPMKEHRDVWIIRVMEGIWRAFVPKPARPKVKKLTSQLRERCGFSPDEALRIAKKLAHAPDETDDA